MMHASHQAACVGNVPCRRSKEVGIRENAERWCPGTLGQGSHRASEARPAIRRSCSPAAGSPLSSSRPARCGRPRCRAARRPRPCGGRWRAAAGKRRVMMPTWPFQNTRSPRIRPSRSLADRRRRSPSSRLLHVAVARAVQAGGLHGDLQQARAVDAEPGLAAPDDRERRRSARRRRRSRRRSGRARRCGGRARSWPSSSLAKVGPISATASDAFMLSVHPRAGFDVGRRVEERAERLHPVRRALDLRGQRRRRAGSRRSRRARAAPRPSRRARS